MRLQEVVRKVTPLPSVSPEKCNQSSQSPNSSNTGSKISLYETTSYVRQRKLDRLACDLLLNSGISHLLNHSEHAERAGNAECHCRERSPEALRRASFQAAENAWPTMHDSTRKPRWSGISPDTSLLNPAAEGALHAKIEGDVFQCRSRGADGSHLCLLHSMPRFHFAGRVPGGRLNHPGRGRLPGPATSLWEPQYFRS